VSELPALVEPSGWLSRRDITHYSRQIILPEIRVTGQKRLKGARVLCLGAGGLSAVVLTYLAAAGVGSLGIIDLEEPGSERALGSLKALSPSVRLSSHEERLDPNSARKLFAQYDVVVDATDDRTTSCLADYACATVNRPLIWGSAGAREGRAAVFWAGHGPRLRDVDFAADGPGPASADERLPGMVQACEACVGTILATEAVKLIAGIGEPLLGRMLVHDLLAMEYQVMAVQENPDFAAPAGEVTPEELRSMLDRGDPVDLIDVREPYEWEISRIPGGRRVPMAQWLDGSATPSLSRELRPVFYCRSGNRTVEVLAMVRRSGFPDAVHLRGGVNAWANKIDQSLPVY
jgi:sulfur-carrier protein adenylyltransferase/sulfurtransferase